MTESDLHAVLLMRAFEQAPGPVPGFALADPAGAARRGDGGKAVAGAEGGEGADIGVMAGREARLRLGAQAAPEAWLSLRARLGLARLAEHEPTLAGWRGTVGDRHDKQHDNPAGNPGLMRAGLLLVLLAGVIGLSAESIGAGRTINLLAPPLLGLLAWNGVVYALLLGSAVWPGRGAGGAAPRTLPSTRTCIRPFTSAASLQPGLLRWAARAGAGLGRVLPGAAGAGVAGAAAQGVVPSRAAGSAWLRFGHDWQLATQPLQAARAAAWLHAAAATLALGAVLSLYARGLVLDYRAGWDSTFLDAASVRQLLGWLLGPAAALSGQALPDAQALAGLRLASGGGEGAARWIHLWALTLVLAVLLPRGLLAALAARRARAWAACLPLPAAFEDLQRLLRSASGRPLPVIVLPYSYALDAGRQAALARVLVAQFGPDLQLDLLASLPLGAEDDLPRWCPSNAAATVVALFALTATPERETHGAFVQALVQRLGQRPAGAALLRVMVDESGFRQRLVGASAADRLVQRRAAWQSLLHPAGLSPLFIDLSSAASPAADPQPPTGRPTAGPTSPADGRAR